MNLVLNLRSNLYSLTHDIAFFLKRLRSHKSKLVFVVFSPEFTPAMEISYKYALDFGIECIWIRHARADCASTVPEISNSIKVRVLNSRERFLESFLYDECRLIDPQALFIVCASDEIFTPELFQRIVEMNGERGIRWESVGVNRIWVKKRLNDWFFSTLPSKEGFDIQYRIFSPSRTKALRKVHTPGFKMRGKRSLIEGFNIVHLDWQVNSVEDRRNKLLYYDELQPGQFLSKFRYYLPECFTENELNWQIVPHSERNSLSEYEVLLNSSS